MNKTFLHLVYFWLKEDAPADAAEKLIAGCLKLRSVPGVVRLEAGTPAPSTRPVVDSSYGVCLFVEFTDADAQEVYQDHPDHHAFIAECSPLWSRVQVYDTLLK
jgi:hypothetical protein